MRHVLPILAIAVAALGSTYRPALAIDEEQLYFRDELTPDVSMVHPGKKKAALVVTASMDLVACDFWYRHNRSGEDYTDDLPALESGGEIKVTMKHVRGRRKKKIGRQVDAVSVLQVEGSTPSLRYGVVAWADSPLICDWCVATYDFTFKRSKKFPLHVEPGDVLLWTVAFAGMPRIEVDRDGDPGYEESITFHSKCSTCGTIEFPCALPGW